MRFAPPSAQANRQEAEKGNGLLTSEKYVRPESRSAVNGKLTRANTKPACTNVPQCAQRDYRSSYSRNLAAADADDSKNKPKNKELKVNLLNCKYDVVRAVSNALKFEEVEEEGDAQWDLYWTDLSVSMERVARLQPFQCINHFPGMMEICRKATLARNLKKMRALFPNDYAFFPESWSLPSEVHQWRASCRQRRLEGQRATYIVKPDAGAMGRGIYLVRREEDLDLTNPDFIGWVVQEYVERPLLIDEYKFDLRLYVLVTSVDPLRIYLFDEGLARFATAKYSKPDNKNIGTMNMHLTNYSINKKSQDYVSAETDPHKGSKRRLTAIMQLLDSMGHDSKLLMDKIKQLIVKTLVVVAPYLKSNYRTMNKRSTFRRLPSTPSRCFELLGFDVLIDDQLNPLLVEVNHSPSFEIDTKLDTEIKSCAIRDAIQALGLTIDQRERLLHRQRLAAKKRLYSGVTQTPKHLDPPPLLSRRPIRGTSAGATMRHSNGLVSRLAAEESAEEELRRAADDLLSRHRPRHLPRGPSYSRQAAKLPPSSGAAKDKDDTSASESDEELYSKPAKLQLRLGGFTCIYPQVWPSAHGGMEAMMAPFYDAAMNMSHA